MRRSRSVNFETETATAPHEERPLTYNLRRFGEALARADVEGALRRLAVERVLLRPFMNQKRSRFRPAASVLDAYLILQGTNEKMRTAVLESLSTNLGRASRDPISVLVRAIVPYRAAMVGGALLKSVHRDVRAVRYLLSRGLRPDQVAEEAAKPGQGIETWALAYTNASADEQARRRKEPVETPYSSRTPIEDAYGIVPPSSLRLAWTDGSGTVRRLDTLNLTLDDDGEPVRASISDAISLLRRLETAARRKAAIARARQGASGNDD
jgi:hypothetical protein